MTVTDTSSRSPLYVGNGTTTDFAFAMKVLSADDIDVYELDTETGETTTLVKDTDYTVALVDGGEDGGTVTISPAPVSTKKIRIYRNTPFDQEVALTNQANFSPSVINSSLDKHMLTLQELREKVDRAIVVETMSTDTPEELVTEMREGIELADQAISVANAALASAIAYANSVLNAAKAYTNSAIAGLVSGGAVSATVWETAIAAGETDITTPYKFTKGLLSVGGTLFNLADPTGGTTLDNTGANTIIELDDAAVADMSVMLIVFS